MPSLQIKDVPAHVHAKLRRRAAAEGVTLEQYLLERLHEAVQVPTLDEILELAGARSGGTSKRTGIRTLRRDS